MGYLAYETGRCVENLPGNAIDDIMLPEMCFAFYDRVIARDCHNGNTWLVVAHPDNPKPLLADAAREMKALPPEYPSRRDAAETQFKSNFSRKGYIEAVRSVKEYIIAGDINIYII